MNINHYKRAVERFEIRPELKKEIVEMSMEKNNKKHKFSKKRAIPVIAAVVVGCTTVTAVCADQFVGIFKKDTNFQMNIRTIEESTDEQAEIYHAVHKKWNKDALNALFMDGKTAVDGEEYQSDLNPDVKRKWESYDDGTTVVYEDGDIMYYRQSDYDYRYIADLILNGKDAGEVLFPKSSIEGFAVETALEQSDRIMNELGMSVHSKEVIALDAENLKAVDDVRNGDNDRIDKHGETLPEWTSEQEAYMIIYSLETGNMPVSRTRFISNNVCSEGSMVYAIVSRNGLEAFQASIVYDATESGESVNVCTVEEAAEAVAVKFDKNIASHPTDIENCKLVYVPVAIEFGKSYELRPVWEFYSNEHISWYNSEFEKESMDYYDTVFVDAETCEVIDQTQY